jgi:plastocyanin
MLRRVLLGTVVIAAACGGSGGGGGGGGGGVDAPGSGSSQDTVKTVSCTGATVAATVTTPNDGFAYSSSPAGASSTDSAITINGIVEFMPGATHPVGPNPGAGMTDNGLVAPASETTCLQFTAVGTYHYKCTVHGFTGTVTVTQ